MNGFLIALGFVVVACAWAIMVGMATVVMSHVFGFESKQKYSAFDKVLGVLCIILCALVPPVILAMFVICISVATLMELGSDIMESVYDRL